MAKGDKKGKKIQFIHTFLIILSHHEQCTMYNEYSYSLTSDHHYRYQHIFIVSNHINVMQCNEFNIH